MRKRSAGLLLGTGIATAALIALAVAMLAGAGGANGNKTHVKADMLTGFQEATPARLVQRLGDVRSDDRR